MNTKAFRGIEISIDVRKPAPIALALLCFIFALGGCSSGANPFVHPPELSITPASATVAAGSTATFTAVFSPSEPTGSSLAWAVTPASGGTITSAGVYTAPATVGKYTVVATWTARGGDGKVTASASVEVIAPQQADSAINPDMVQASGATQTGGTVQIGSVVGQSVPSVISSDPNGDVQVGSGFVPPITCTDCDVVF
jgi:uncharacterized protein YjdB